MALPNISMLKISNIHFLKNISWNLGGQIAPLIAALVSIPLLIKMIGVDRFGIMTIAWMLIGYFSLFDFGLGRALTQVVAKKLATNKNSEVPTLVWSGLILMTALGLFAGIVVLSVSHLVVYNILNIPADLRNEAQHSFYVLAASIPMVVVATGLRGVLEAKQEFRSINLVRIPLGVMMYLAPLCVLPFTQSLVPIFISLMIVRLVTTCVLAYLCWKSFENIRHIKFSMEFLPELFQFGGWLTVSNIVSPIMVQMDRFIIGAILTMSAVAYYTTPYEVVTKLLVVPASIAGVCFPMFTKLMGEREQVALEKLYVRSCVWIFSLMIPAALIFIIFGSEILKIWLNKDFALQSSLVLKILTVGVVINGIAQIPYAYIQGAGRSDITAKLHIFELIIYLPLLFFLIKSFGINGAAIAWCTRTTIDGLALSIFRKRIRNKNIKSL